jgi:Fe-S cluster biogenesis protein NfuA
MTQALNVQEAGARVEELLGQLRDGADPSVAERAEELVRVLMELYGAGLERAVDLVGREPAGAEIVGRLAKDPLLASLLVLHGLHPVPVSARINEALGKVKPYLGNASVELLGFDDDGVAHLRIEGNCESCGTSTAGAKAAIEKAVIEAAPEAAAVEIELPAVNVAVSNAVPVEFIRRTAPPAPNGGNSAGPVAVSIGRKRR